MDASLERNSPHGGALHLPPADPLVADALSGFYKPESILARSCVSVPGHGVEVAFLFPAYDRTEKSMGHVSGVQMHAALLEGCVMVVSLNGSRKDVARKTRPKEAVDNAEGGAFLTESPRATTEYPVFNGESRSATSAIADAIRKLIVERPDHEALARLDSLFSHGELSREVLLSLVVSNDSDPKLERFAILFEKWLCRPPTIGVSTDLTFAPDASASDRSTSPAEGATAAILAFVDTRKRFRVLDVLSRLSEGQACSKVELAHAVGMSESALGQCIKELVELEAIEPSGLPRCARYTLSTPGRAAHGKLAEGVLNWGISIAEFKLKVKANTQLNRNVQVLQVLHRNIHERATTNELVTQCDRFDGPNKTKAIARACQVLEDWGLVDAVGPGGDGRTYHLTPKMRKWLREDPQLLDT